MGVERVERRLAAIVAVDVAGYSRLMGRDEEGTLAALRAIRRDLSDPRIKEHQGRIVKTMGDGLLIEFASVVGAVRCSVEVQRAMAERNEGVPADTRIDFRVGIHQGDIIVENGDIFGDGVNLAARLEGLAEPGGICVSRVVRDEIRDKLDVVFDDLGEQRVKNIARPVHAFRISPDTLTHPVAGAPVSTLSRIAGEGAGARSAEAGEGHSAPLPLPEKPSLVVLPFQNMSGDPEQEYFADGMVEEITTAIARLPWLFVIARNSAFTYKGRAVDVKQVARELGVRYVLEGSVRKAGNRVRITGQLIDTATSAHIWADRFDGALDDIFDLQDQVASSFAGAIEPRLRLAEIERSARKPTASLDAYDLCLRAQALNDDMTREANRQAISLLGRSLAIDPSYALAAALVGWCRLVQMVQGWGAISADETAEAVRLAKNVIDRGGQNPEALWLAAWTLSALAGDHATAESAVDRALALNPNSARAWMTSGFVRCFRNQPKAAIEALERAMRLSPFDPYAFCTQLGFGLAYVQLEKYENAMEWIDRSLNALSRWAVPVRYKVVLLAQRGDIREAQDWLVRLLEHRPGLTIADIRVETTRYLRPEVVKFMCEGLRKAGLPEE